MNRNKGNYKEKIKQKGGKKAVHKTLRSKSKEQNQETFSTDEESVSPLSSEDECK